jgi:hypothetical protein
MAAVIEAARSSHSLHVHLPAIRNLASERLRTYFIEGHRDFFAEVPEDYWVYILYRWERDWAEQPGENYAAIQSYVMSLIDKSPNYLRQLLKPFLAENLHKPGVVSFGDFIQVYDPALLQERIDRYGDTVFTTPEERAAAQNFLQQYAEHQSI